MYRCSPTTGQTRPTISGTDAEDPTRIKDIASRRKQQNRIAQRNHSRFLHAAALRIDTPCRSYIRSKAKVSEGEKIRRQIAQLEARVASANPEPSAVNNYNNYPRPTSTPNLSPPGFASPGYGIGSLYDPNNGIISSQINQAQNLQHEARPTEREQQQIGLSPFHPSQHSLFGGVCHDCSLPKASSSVPAGCPAVNISQAPYNQLNQHQQSPQPQPSQVKCSNNTPHQCVADSALPVSEQPPLAPNLAEYPQPQWPHTSCHGGTPIPRLPCSQIMNMNGELPIKASLRSERISKGANGVQCQYMVIHQSQYRGVIQIGLRKPSVQTALITKIIQKIVVARSDILRYRSILAKFCLIQILTA